MATNVPSSARRETLSLFPVPEALLPGRVFKISRGATVVRRYFANSKMAHITIKFRNIGNSLHPGPQQEGTLSPLAAVLHFRHEAELGSMPALKGGPVLVRTRV